MENKHAFKFKFHCWCVGSVCSCSGNYSASTLSHAQKMTLLIPNIHGLMLTFSSNTYGPRERATYSEKLKNLNLKISHIVLYSIIAYQINMAVI